MARGVPSARISTPGGEGGDDRRPKVAHNGGGDSSPPFCTAFWGGEPVHRRPDRRWTPGEAGPPPRLFAAQHGEIPRSPSPESPKRQGRLSWAVLDRGLVARSRPSPSLPAMDTPGGGCPPAFSQPSAEGFPDPRVQSVQNDEGNSLPPFWTAGWVAEVVHRPPDRRWIPGEAGAASLFRTAAPGDSQISEHQMS